MRNGGATMRIGANAVVSSRECANGGMMMHVNPLEAAKIYAKACKAWYGPRAQRVVQKRVQEMRTRGDQSGIRAWEQVAAELKADEDSHDKVGHQQRPS